MYVTSWDNTYNTSLSINICNVYCKISYSVLCNKHNFELIYEIIHCFKFKLVETAIHNLKIFGRQKQNEINWAILGFGLESYIPIFLLIHTPYQYTCDFGTPICLKTSDRMTNCTQSLENFAVILQKRGSLPNFRKIHSNFRLFRVRNGYTVVYANAIYLQQFSKKFRILYFP